MSRAKQFRTKLLRCSASTAGQTVCRTDRKMLQNHGRICYYISRVQKRDCALTEAAYGPEHPRTVAAIERLGELKNDLNLP